MKNNVKCLYCGCEFRYPLSYSFGEKRRCPDCKESKLLRDLKPIDTDVFGYNKKPKDQDGQ